MVVLICLTTLGPAWFSSLFGSTLPGFSLKSQWQPKEIGHGVVLEESNQVFFVLLPWGSWNPGGNESLARTQTRTHRVVDWVMLWWARWVLHPYPPRKNWKIFTDPGLTEPDLAGSEADCHCVRICNFGACLHWIFSLYWSLFPFFSSVSVQSRKQAPPEIWRRLGKLRVEKSRAAKRGGFKRGGFPIWTCPSFFCPFLSFLGLSRFSGIFPICSGMVRGFSRFVLFLFLGLLRAPTRNSPERVRDTIWTFPEKKWETPGFGDPLV